MKENPRKIVPHTDFETARLSRESREGEKPRHPERTAEVIDFDKRKVQSDAEKLAAQTDSGLISGEGAALTWEEAAVIAQGIDDKLFLYFNRLNKDEKSGYLKALESQRGIVSQYHNKDLFDLLEKFAAKSDDFDPAYMRAISEEYLRRYNKLSKKSP